MVRKKTRDSKRLNKSRKRKTKKIKQNEFKKMISEMEQSVQKDHEKCNASCNKNKTNYAKDKKKHQLKQKCHHDCWKKRIKTVKAFHKKYPKEFKVFVKNLDGGGTKKRINEVTENKRKSKEEIKKLRKESRKSNEKFKKELKKCEKKCKNDEEFKKELKEELEKLDRSDLKKMKRNNTLKKCSTECLNDQGLYYGTQKKNGGGNKRSNRKNNKRRKDKEDIPKKLLKKGEDCEKVEKFFKKPVKKGKRMKWSPPIWGIPEDEDRVRKFTKYNVFEEKPVKLPKGYQKAKKFPYDKEHIEDNICGERIPAVKTEVPEFKKGHKHYLIHDNGGRPFAMYVSPKKDAVAIYKLPKGFLEPEGVYHKDKTFVKYYSELVKKIKCKDVFIGVSPKNTMTKFSGGFGKKFDGNTNLIKLSDKRYVYVGETIFEFTSLNKIVDYQSPVGNSDVPYPYAIDEKGNYYLMLDKVIVNFPEKVEDPYDKYWNSGLMTTDVSFTPPKEPVYPNFQDIKGFYILEKGKKEPYTLRHTTEPSKEYDRLVKSIGKPLSIEYTDGTKKDLSKKDYIQLMNDFGKLLNTKPFKSKLIHNYQHPLFQ